MKYSIVIPTYNHCDDLLKPCVESILKYSSLEDIEIIISANGCTDNTSEYLSELKHQLNDRLITVWNDAPLGYAKATNAGIREARTDKIVLFNNDNILLEQQKDDWLNILNAPFEKISTTGISCVSKHYSKHTLRNFAIFFCVMVHRKVFEKIGLLNEGYEYGAGEDIEFCYVAEENGFTIEEEIKTKFDEVSGWWSTTFPIYHMAEGTVHDENLVKNWSSKFNKNMMKVAKKFNKLWNENKMSNDKKIGVITPVYNDSEHIFYAIDSVKIQKLDNVYHYIYDDASTDDLQNALSIFSDDEKIVYIRGEENRGQSFARNTLIERALKDGCDYIAFLDSDDKWTENHLESNIGYLKDYDIVYSTPSYVFENGTKAFLSSIIVPDIFIGKHLRHNNFIWISSAITKSECFKTNLFDSSLNSIEDWDIWLRLFDQNYKFFKNESCTVTYMIKSAGQASLGGQKMPTLMNKHKMLSSLKLHLACGHDYLEDYINIDLYAPEDAKCDVRFDVTKLPYPDNSVDEIRAFHIIEHFDFFEIQNVLKEWHRVLKPGGRLWLETPDFLESCRSFVDGNPSMNIEEWRVLLYNHFFAHPWIPGQTHKFLFTETQLKTNLSWAGFKTVNRQPPSSNYVRPDTYKLFLNVEAFK